MRAWLLAAVIGVGFVANVSGQTPAAVVNQRLRQPTDTVTHDHVIPRSASSRAQSLAPLVSAILPGGGQAILGNDRSIGYFAVEALSWWNLAKAIREQADDEANFKALARRVARARFTIGSPDALPDAPWAYYELMRDHKESGQYSLSATSDIVPETDATTYNGARWVLAQTTNSSHAAALAQYEREAIKPEFEWSWSNAQLQYDLFTRMTDKRNDAYSAGTRAILILGANHFLSMIDAFTTMRLRARAGADGSTSIGASFHW